MNALARATVMLALTLPLVAAGAQAGESAPPLQRIGIVPLRDEGNVRNGAERLSSMLQARLEAKFEEAEFFVVELDEKDQPSGPLLLKEAVELCSETGADGLIDGVFGGVEIVGGTWPNKGGDHPQARGFLRWRLVDGSDGMLIMDGRIEPEKPKVYSPRIRSTRQLQTRVLQDLADEVVAALEGCPRLPGAGEGED
jgi:hypothetical protein